MAKKAKKRKAKTAKAACAACRYWVDANVAADVSGVEQGHCHRFPPPQSAPGTGPWPITLATDWCGEYQA